jgi:hypothetical protein
MVLVTLFFFLPFNQLTRLVAREHFIGQSRRESYKSYSGKESSVSIGDEDFLDWLSVISVSQETFHSINR